MLMLAIFPNTRRLLPLNMALALMKVRLLPLTLALMKVRLVTLAQMKFRPVRMLMLMLPQ
jgi:hypothetical protein